MTTTTVFDLYRSPLNVWVEDNLTREILTELWQDSQLHVLNGGGGEGVRHLVKGAAAHPRLRGRVVGVVDRDFGNDNIIKWSDPQTSIFVLPVHEVENLLLDFDVLGALASVPPEQVRDAAHGFAASRRWWMIGKAVVRELCTDLAGHLPPDPPIDLPDGQALRTWLRDHDYWPNHRARCDRWQDDVHRTVRLDTREAELNAHLGSDAWREHFSGKEIFHHLRSHLNTLDRTPKHQQAATSAQRDEDLAKRIAREMRTRGRIPAPLQQLHTCLRARLQPT